MASADLRALHVAELLERILLSLPMKDILLDQRVCKFWKELVKNSPKLQQALFYQPDYSDTETWTAINWSDIEDDEECLVLEAVTPKAKKEGFGSRWHRKFVMGRSNELLLDYSDASLNDIPETGLSKFLIWDHETCAHLLSLGNSSGHQEAERSVPLVVQQRNRKPTDVNFKPSWSGMLLTQPPSTEIEFCNWHSHGDVPKPGMVGKCRSTKGVTADDLIRVMLENCGEWQWPHYHLQHLYTRDPIATPQINFQPHEGIKDFERLQEITGSKANALALCRRMDRHLLMMKYEEYFSKLVKYDLLQQITRSTDVDLLLWKYEHLSTCEDLKCDGCSALYSAFNNKGQEDVSEEVEEQS